MIEKLIRFALLDQVRGLCAILVFLQHGFYVVPEMKLGAFGVDLFFFLSAFLLTFGLYKTLCGGQSWKHHLLILTKYFVRRICRVYPLFFILVCVLTLGPQSLRDAYYMPPQLDFFKTAFFYEKYRYFVFWTLPVEFSYYFLIPLYVYIVFYTRKYWYVANTMFLLASIYPSLYYYRAPYLNLDSHIGTFLAGSAFGIYFYYAKRSNFTKSQRVFWEVVSFTLAIVIASQASKHIFFKYLQIPFSGDYPYISGFVGILFIKELIHPGIISNCMDWPVFTFSGKISFSVYLLHPIGLHFAKDLKGQDQFLWSAIYTLILGLFGYYVIEAPLEKVSRRICKSLDKILKNKLNLETARIFQV